MKTPMIRPARKSQTATPTTPATIALSDIAEIRWPLNGMADHTITLTPERLAGVLRIVEDVWYDAGWAPLGQEGIATDAGNLHELLTDWSVTARRCPSRSSRF